MADGYPAHGSVSETKLNIPAQGYQQNCQAMNSTDEENMKNSSKSDDIIIKLYDIYIYNYETSVPEKNCWIHHDWIPAVYEDVPSSMKTELFLSYENQPGIVLFTLKKSLHTHLF